MSEGTRLVRLSVDLLSVLGTRTADGRLLTAEWGDPIERVAVEPGAFEDVYVPTITATDDGMTVVRRDICRHVKGTN